MKPANPYPGCYWDKHRETWRIKPRGGKQSTLKRADGSPLLKCAWGGKEFADAYREAMAASVAAPKTGLGPFAPDTFNVYGRRYFSSAKFEKLAPTTKRARRHQVEQFLAEHGEKRVTKLERRHVRAMLDDVASKPGRQRNLRTTIRVLIAPAVDDGLIADPTEGFERPALSKTGWLDWPG